MHDTLLQMLSRNRAESSGGATTWADILQYKRRREHVDATPVYDPERSSATSVSAMQQSDATDGENWYPGATPPLQ